MDNLFLLYPVLESLSNQLEFRFYTLKAGEKLKVMDQCCGGFPFLLSGTLVATQINPNGDVLYLYHIHPGQYCHPVFKCILDPESEKQVEVIALTDVSFAFVTSDVLKSILMLNSTFLLNLYQDCLLKLEDMMTNQRIKEMPVEQRLEAYFRQCRSRYIYTTHQQLADKLQTSREVVSRQLKKMEKEGRLQISRGKIILNEEVF